MRLLLHGFGKSISKWLYAGVILAATAASAQTSASKLPAFDVVSIRPIAAMQFHSDLNSTTYISTAHKACVYTGERVACQFSLLELLEEAFQRKPYEIVGPGWLADGLFVFQATMPSGTSKETARLMLQRALEDRFDLKAHVEQRTIPGCAMVQVKGGARLQPADDAEHQKLLTIWGRGGAFFTYTPGHFAAVAITLDLLARNLKSLAGLDRPIVNMTGLSGSYKVDLHWRTDEESEDAARGIDPRFQNAVKDQLGLDLEKRNIPAQVLVVDHVNRAPSEN
jgi:uncharacterized protein (TIGR03435 family)